MLLYDNRSRLRLLLQLRGSIYKRIYMPLISVSVYIYVLHFALQYYPEAMPVVDHPFVAQSFGTLMAFAVCFRVNIAWNRFWDGCREMYTMFSKWADAYAQLQGFLNYSSRSPFKKADLVLLQHARNEITHYFSLLSALAYERLSRGDICRMEVRSEKGVPWAEQIAMREELYCRDLTGFRNLVPMRTRIIKDKDSKRDLDNGESPFQEKYRMSKSSKGSQPSQSVVGELSKDDPWDTPVDVVGRCSEDEYAALKESKHRVSLVIMWINEMVTSLHHHLDVPAPILSRVYQELSNGALGYNQAEKLADIPFPFIFTQLLALQVHLFALIAPWVFTMVTGKSWLTPIISIVVVVSYWALNEIAKELENPFGSDANDVPLHDAHSRFVELIAEMHRMNLPHDREYLPPDFASASELAAELAKEGLSDENQMGGRPSRRRSLLYLPTQPASEMEAGGATSTVAEPSQASLACTTNGHGDQAFPPRTDTPPESRLSSECMNGAAGNTLPGECADRAAEGAQSDARPGS